MGAGMTDDSGEQKEDLGRVINGLIAAMKLC